MRDLFARVVEGALEFGDQFAALGRHFVPQLDLLQVLAVQDAVAQIVQRGPVAAHGRVQACEIRENVSLAIHALERVE